MTYEAFPTIDDLKPPRKGFKRCAKCGRNRALKFFKPKGRNCSTCLKRRVKFASRDVRVLETHYITSDEYDMLLAAQEGLCYICEGSRSYFLDIDHDHAIEKLLLPVYGAALAHRMSIRGLLCKTCNRRLLPAVKDSPDTLRRAIQYLQHWPAGLILAEDA